ncbi:hypothetical protein ACPA54_37895 [Uniformispora flossi]|uniref:hypothetical protein n=1 Tax=Uniformispora flossi TaxID=3390723 RepID=UPI003C2E470C
MLDGARDSLMADGWSVAVKSAARFDARAVQEAVGQLDASLSAMADAAGSIGDAYVFGEHGVMVVECKRADWVDQPLRHPQLRGKTEALVAAMLAARVRADVRERLARMPMSERRIVRAFLGTFLPRWVSRGTDAVLRVRCQACPPLLFRTGPLTGAATRHAPPAAGMARTVMAMTGASVSAYELAA